MWLISYNLFIWSLIWAPIQSIYLPLRLFLLLTHFLRIVAVVVSFRLFLAACTTKLGSVIFDIEFNSSELYNVTSTQFIIQIILSWFRVPDHNKHLVVDVFIWNGVAVAISWSVSYDCVIFYLKLAILLSHYYHWLCCFVYIFWLCPNGYKFDIIRNSQYFATSLSFDVFLGDIFGLIIKETMRVSGPGDASHVDFIFLLSFELVLQTLLEFLSICRHLLSWRLLVATTREIVV